MPAPMSQEVFISKVRAKFPNLDFSNTVYRTAREPVEFICPKHGLVSVTKASLLVQEGRGGCPSCNLARSYEGREGNKGRLGKGGTLGAALMAQMTPEQRAEHGRKISEGKKRKMETI